MLIGKGNAKEKERYKFCGLSLPHSGPSLKENSYDLQVFVQT